MKYSILATTTNSVENAEIIKYIDLISTNVVVGTNLFSDLGASFTDLFGGYSDTYQNKLQGIYKIAIDKLKQKAVTIGANAIVGLKIDFDEISGKGKSMFMISAVGMAVSINYSVKAQRDLENKISNIVESEELEKELAKLQIQKALSSDKLPDSEQWIYLLNNPFDDIINVLIDKYLEVYKLGKEFRSEKQTLLINNISSYLSISNKNIVVDALYTRISEKFEPIIALVEALKLFSPKHIQYLIKSDKIDETICCLGTSKSFYTQDDLSDMHEIINLLDNLPDKGKIETVKGLLSKAKEKYICPNGHSNDLEDIFCSNYECQKNIKGLTQTQLNSIDLYKEKVAKLSKLLTKNLYK